jgi:hypothetical protein
MATNTLNIVATDAGKTFPLRGDMAVTLNFVPDNHFWVVFRTEDATVYTVSSNSALIARMDGTTGSAFSLGGARGMFAKFMFDTNKNLFVVTDNNLIGGTGGGGTAGPPGAAATITVGTVTTGAPGSSVQVTNSGTATDAVLNFAIPKGADGASGIPAGGTAGQLLAKASATDRDVTWIDAPAGTGGSTGGGRRAEVVLTPAADGSVTLDGAVSDTFAVVLNQPKVTFNNPVNFTTKDEIHVTMQQDATGGRVLGYGRAFLLPNAQPYKPPQNANAISFARINPTNISGTLQYVFKADPDYTVVQGFGAITEIGRIGLNKYFTINDTFTALTSGQTAYVIRNGLSAEATATKIGGNPAETYTIAGQAVPANGTDQRPILTLLQTDFSDGPPAGANRPAWGKAILNFEGSGTFNVRDVIVQGARHDEGSARGIAPNGGCSMNLNNVKVYNCNNGTLWGNADFTGNVNITDCVFDFNGIGTNGVGDGFSHNLYAGKSPGTLTVRRSSFIASQKGHDFKTRQAVTNIYNTLIEGAFEGRELELPEGGVLYVENCIIRKYANAAQNDLVRIGDEGTDTSRPRQYTFKNVRFENQRGAGTDCTFIWNQDDTTDVVCIDCEFVGDAALANNVNAVQGRRGRVVIQNTGGPLGPRAGEQVGYVAVAMTPAA